MSAIIVEIKKNSFDVKCDKILIVELMSLGWVHHIYLTHLKQNTIMLLLNLYLNFILIRFFIKKEKNVIEIRIKKKSR